MPSIAQLPSGRYRARVRCLGLPPTSRTFKTRRAAERWAHALEAEAERGFSAAGSRLTLSEAITRYRNAPGRELSSYQKSMLDWWDQRLGARLIVTLGRGDFLDAQEALQRRPHHRRPGAISKSTVNRWIAQISAVLTDCMKREELHANPARIGALTEPPGRDRVLSSEERRRLLEVCAASSEPALLRMVYMAMVSGARAGELLRLTWADIDFERGIAGLLKTKNKERRSIPIIGPALELLKSDREAVKDLSQPVLRNRDGSAPFRYRRPWEAARAAAGFPELHVHDLRHTNATELLRAGASQQELQQLLGHSDPRLTKRYAHLLAPHIAELGERLVDRMFKTEGED